MSNMVYFLPVYVVRIRNLVAFFVVQYKYAVMKKIIVNCIGLRYFGAKRSLPPLLFPILLLTPMSFSSSKGGSATEEQRGVNI